MSPYDPRPPASAAWGSIASAAVRGGVEEALDRCASGLAARGHEVTVVCSAARAASSHDADGVRVVRVRRHGALFRAPIAPFWRHVPPEADVVHVPGTYPLVSDLVPLRERSRRAVVLDYHFDVHANGGAMRMAASLHAVASTRLMLASTRVVCKSADYARHSPFLRKVPPARLDVVPNGVDLDRFALSRGRGADVLFVGRLVPYKGVEVLLRAMPAIHAATGARLTVAGDGPLRGRLAALAWRVGAPARFLGRVDDADLPRLYGSHALTVLPSVNGQEAFGLALLESMATGTPVVASALPGVREIARLAGEVTPPGDGAALARTVVRALARPEAHGPPEAIRARVAARFAWPRIVASLEAVHDRALRDFRGAAA